MYFALYKASNAPKGEGRTNVALATSRDGLEWRKHGILKVNGKVQPEYLQLYGGIFAGTMGPVFIGLTRRYLINGCGLARHFEAYIIDYRSMNLELLYRAYWKPLSPYERGLSKPRLHEHNRRPLQKQSSTLFRVNRSKIYGGDRMEITG